MGKDDLVSVVLGWMMCVDNVLFVGFGNKIDLIIRLSKIKLIEMVMKCLDMLLWYLCRE